MSAPDLTGARWRTSSYSGNQGTNNDCVEVALAPELVAVRDSKHRAGACHVVPPAAWAGFLAGVRSGEFHR